PGDREDDRCLARDGLPRHEGARGRRLHRAHARGPAAAAREDQRLPELMARASTASAGRVPAATNFGLPDKALRPLQEIRWIAVFVVGLYVAVMLATYDREDPGGSHSVNHAELANGGGWVGAWFADFLLYQFGTSAWLLVVLLVIAA